MKCIAIDNEIKLYHTFEAETLEQAFRNALETFGYKVSLSPQFKKIDTKSEWYQFDSIQIKIEKE